MNPRLVPAGWIGVPGNEAIEGVWDMVPRRVEPALGSFVLSFHRTASTTQSTLRSINCDCSNSGFRCICTSDVWTFNFDQQAQGRKEEATGTHFGELVEQLSDCPSNDIRGFVREIDEGFDGLLQGLVCLDLADVDARMGRELEQGMNINR